MLECLEHPGGDLFARGEDRDARRVGGDELGARAPGDRVDRDGLRMSKEGRAGRDHGHRVDATGSRPDDRARLAPAPLDRGGRDPARQAGGRVDVGPDPDRAQPRQHQPEQHRSVQRAAHDQATAEALGLAEIQRRADLSTTAATDPRTEAAAHRRTEPATDPRGNTEPQRVDDADDFDDDILAPHIGPASGGVETPLPSVQAGFDDDNDGQVSSGSRGTPQT